MNFEVGTIGLKVACQKMFCVPGSPHPTSNHWKSQHPFHGRLTSNMVCKHCEHQVWYQYLIFSGSFSFKIHEGSSECGPTPVYGICDCLGSAHLADGCLPEVTANIHLILRWRLEQHPIVDWQESES